PHAQALESSRDGDTGEEREEAGLGRCGPKEPRREKTRVGRRLPGPSAGALPRRLQVRDDDRRPETSCGECPRTVLGARDFRVVLDLATDLERQRASHRRDRQEREAHQRAAMRTRGTRTISSIVPSFWLRV